MYTREQECYGKLGKDYWWLGGKYDIVIDLMRWVAGSSLGKILDVGCGPGNMIDLLKNFGEVHGIDFSEDAIRLAQNKGYRSLEISRVERIPHADSSFDAAVALDILEHVADDSAALGELHRILKPGGYLFLSLPAYKFLWGEHDERYGHLRRYTKGEVDRKLRESGFGVVKLSYIEPLFLLPLFLFRNAKKILNRKSDDFVALPRTLNRILREVIATEKYLLRLTDIPFGVSIVGVARKLA